MSEALDPQPREADLPPPADPELLQLADDRREVLARIKSILSRIGDDVKRRDENLRPKPD